MIGKSQKRFALKLSKQTICVVDMKFISTQQNKSTSKQRKMKGVVKEGDGEKGEVKGERGGRRGKARKEKGLLLLVRILNSSRTAKLGSLFF